MPIHWPTVKTPTGTGGGGKYTSYTSSGAAVSNSIAEAASSPPVYFPPAGYTVRTSSSGSPMLIPEIALNPQAAATEYIKARGCDDSMDRADEQNSGGWLQGLKDFGNSIFNYMQQSGSYWGDKALNPDHLGDFLYSGANWLTLGMLDSIVQGYKTRNEAMWEDPSLYNVLNWASSGLLDTVKGTFAPEEPLSLEHWLDSASLALVVVGGYKTVKTATSTGPANTINTPHPSTATGLADDIADDFIAGNNQTTRTVWDDIIATSDDIPGTKVPSTFQVKLGNDIAYINPQTGENALWTNANATEHMGEYIERLGNSISADIRSQTILDSYSAALNQAMKELTTLEPGRYFSVYGNWELGINTQTGVVYHAKMIR